MQYLKDVSQIVVGTIAVVTLLKGLHEYRKQGLQKRCEQFLVFRDRFDRVLDICDLLEKPSAHSQNANVARAELRVLPFQRKLHFIGIYEEIALSMNAGLIKEAVIFYMFGYYAILCWECDLFWDDCEHKLNRQSLYCTFLKSLRSERVSCTMKFQ